MPSGIVSFHSLENFFHDSEKKQKLIGIEGEKIGVIEATGRTAQYNGKKGYLAVLGRLYRELGWEITKRMDNYIMEMQRGKTIIALESDGRIELSGSPHESLHDVAREFRIHQNEITEISNIYGIAWLGIGYQPISKTSDIHFIPKERTVMCSKYMSHKGPPSVAWEKKTASTQVNLDYENEDDFALKSKVLFKISPLITAMYANSPFSLGKFSGYLSYRSQISLLSDPERFIVPEWLYKSGFRYADWINYALDLPIMFLLKDEIYHEANTTFRNYMKNGYGEFTATMKDWENHLTTIYFPARMKKVIEFRNCDSVPPYLVPSVAALIKGIVYNREALEYLDGLTSAWSYNDFIDLQKDVAKSALKAKIDNNKLLDLCRELLSLSTQGLKNYKILDINGEDESVYLEPIKEFIFVKEQSPAEWIVEQWMGKWNKSFYPVIEWYKY